MSSTPPSNNAARFGAAMSPHGKQFKDVLVLMTCLAGLKSAPPDRKRRWPWLEKNLKDLCVQLERTQCDFAEGSAFRKSFQGHFEPLLQALGCPTNFVAVYMTMATAPNPMVPASPRNGESIEGRAKEIRAVIVNKYVAVWRTRLGPDGQPRSGSNWDDVLNEVLLMFYIKQFNVQVSGEKKELSATAVAAITLGKYLEVDVRDYVDVVPPAEWRPEHWFAFVLFGPYGEIKYGMSPCAYFAISSKKVDEGSLSGSQIQAEMNAARDQAVPAAGSVAMREDISKIAQSINALVSRLRELDTTDILRKLQDTRALAEKATDEYEKEAAEGKITRLQALLKRAIEEDRAFAAEEATADAAKVLANAAASSVVVTPGSSPADRGQSDGELDEDDEGVDENDIPPAQAVVASKPKRRTKAEMAAARAAGRAGPLKKRGRVQSEPVESEPAQPEPAQLASVQASTVPSEFLM
jgi:hypothetical protein